MCQVTAKSSDLTTPPPPPPPPLTLKLLKTKLKPQPWTPPSSSSQFQNTTQAQPNSRLNPYAEPFSPLTQTPFNGRYLLSPMMMTRPFSYHPMIYFYHPTAAAPVNSSYPHQGRGNFKSSITEGYGVFLNGKKEEKKKVVSHVRRQIWEPKKADNNEKKKSDDIDFEVMFAGGNTTLMIKNIPNRLK